MRSVCRWFDNADCSISRGVPRLQYLVAKGALVRKGQMVKTKFSKISKYSQMPQGMLLFI